MKKYCYKSKKTGKKVCPAKYVVRPDSTPYVQDAETGKLLGRAEKK